MARWQLMHEYAQKSISTTLPRNDARSIGLPSGVLSHWVIPLIAAPARTVAALSAVGAVGELAFDPAARFSLRWMSPAPIPFCIAAV